MGLADKVKEIEIEMART
jgi:small GTP-binding protein